MTEIDLSNISEELVLFPDDANSPEGLEDGFDEGVEIALGLCDD